MANILPKNFAQLPESVAGLIGARIYVPMGKVPFTIGEAGSEPDKERTLGTPQFLYLIFQLMQAKRSLITGKINEIKELNVVSLAVLPSSIEYRYSGRSLVEQTAERLGQVSGFRDIYGRGLTEVTINGTFGQFSRESQKEFKTGWDRLRDFRENIFKASHSTVKIEETSGIVTNDKKLVDSNNLTREGGSDIQSIFILNFFDFINEEQFAVDIHQFTIAESTDHNNLPRYTLSMKEAGPVINEYKSQGGDQQLDDQQIAADVAGADRVAQLASVLGSFDKLKGILT